MNPDHYQSVIWDLDGTLADSAADIAVAVNQVLEDAELNTLLLSDIQLMVGNGAGKLLHRAFTAVSGIDRYDADSAYTSFLNYYHRHSCVHTVCYPDIRETLTGLHKSGYLQGVCTNKPYAITIEILLQLGIERYFGSVIGGDSTLHRKPHPLPLATCIEQLGTDGKRVLMVGDSAADVGAAKAGGVDIAVVSWGYSQSPAAELGGDYLVNSASELLHLLAPDAQ